MKRIIFFFVLLSFIGWGQTTIFNETVGTASGTLTIAGNTFDNSATLTFTGDADTRSSTVSTGYIGASGLRNVFFTNTVGRYFEISGIDTSNYTNLVLSLGHYKSTTAGNNELLVEVSADGITYTNLSYSRSTGTGTANWVLISPTGSIPSTANLRIRFTQNSATTQFRIDDIKLVGDLSTSSPVLLSSTTNLTGFNYIGGSGPSASQSFTIDGSNLTPASANLSITATTNFEVSLDNLTFSSSINLPYTAGTISSQAVYVRLISGLASGAYSGTVTVTGGGATDVVVSLSGNIVEPFIIPYFNAYALQTDYDTALSQGFNASSGVVYVTSAGGYIRIPLNEYYETPTIDFSQHSNLFVQFSSTTFGGATGQELTLSMSEDNGITYTTVGTIVVPASYQNFKLVADVSLSSSTTGKLKLQLTNGGSGSARVRNLYIESATIWDGTSWSNVSGPTTNLFAIIEGNYNTGTNGNFIAKQVESNNGNFVIDAATNIEIVNALNINNSSTFTVESDGTLIQQNDINNSGNITVNRNSAPMIRLDYTAWSSPVSGQNLLAFSPNTYTNRFYTYDATGNSWTAVDPVTNNFSSGQGCLIRVDDTWSPTVYTAYNGVFTGVPNNGNYNVSTAVGYNLLGNPYPSPIDATTFINNNSTILTTGTLYFWTHAVAQNGSYVAQSNYASYTAAGGVAATAGGAQPDGIIQVGQGFLTEINAASSVQFNNGQRLNASNGQFFKASTVEKHRLWLSLSDTSNNFNQMMIAYMSNATNDVDFAIDAKLFTNSASTISSFLNNERYVIQGRPLSFDSSDEVPLSFTASEDGTYAIALDNFDGLFSSQDIYLWDKTLNIIHDLKVNSYTFLTLSGTYNSRFSVVYTSTLSNDTAILNSNEVLVYNNNGQLKIESPTQSISAYAVYDIQGRKLVTDVNVNLSTVSVLNLEPMNQFLIVEIQTEKGSVTKKVLF